MAPRRREEGVSRGIYLLPNLLTSASLSSGFFSIVSTYNGEYLHATLAILLAAFLDGVDGRIARLTRSTSRFGIEYDSLSDLVAFGAAPAFLAFAWTLDAFGKLGWVAAFLYVVSGALRLARFNVQAQSIEGKSHFVGLPIPSAACLLTTTILLYQYLKFEAGLPYVPILVLVYALAVLMVTKIRYYSFKELDLSYRKPFSLLVICIFLLTVIIAVPHVMLFLSFLAYACSGPVGALWSLWRAPRRRRPAQRPRPPRPGEAEPPGPRPELH
ncbi:MAG: CDP-diacylglycerol--serine O-phosphatidyltransferase [Deltaproteobacteria bacterium]|nr:CDP-diacylglycerol--serine O-phosphatidyltransferase [Deltaproteobacteria bacterium]